MTDPQELALRLARLQERAQELQELLANPPEWPNAVGPVTATHSSDGPSIRIDDDWQSKVSPDEVARAITTAVALAMPIPEPPQTDSSDIHVDHVPWDIVDTARQVSDMAAPLIERAVRAAEGAQSWTPDDVAEEPDAVTGSNESRRLRVVFRQGRFSRCEVDPQWAAGQAGKTLAMAFNEAVADAQARMAMLPEGPESVEPAIHDAVSIVTFLRGKL